MVSSYVHEDDTEVKSKIILLTFTFDRHCRAFDAAVDVGSREKRIGEQMNIILVYHAFG